MSKPVIFVGMGGTGADIMMNLWKKIKQKKGDNAEDLLQNNFLGLVIDTADRPAGLDSSIEFVPLSTTPTPEKALQGAKKAIKGFDQIWPVERIGAPRDPGNGAGQDPSYTVLALFHTLWSDVRFQTAMKRFSGMLCDHEGEFYRDKQQRPRLPIVYLGGMCGGTGPGLNLHVPFIVRAVMQAHLTENVGVDNVGVLYTPEATSTFVRNIGGGSQANAYANIVTLDNWQLMNAGDEDLKKYNVPRLSIDVTLPGLGKSGKDLDINYKGAPYDMLYLLGNSFENGGAVDANELTSVASEYLYATFCGTNTSQKIIDYTFSNHFNHCKNPCRIDNEIRAQSYGSFSVGRLLFPRRNIMKYCGDYVAARWRQEFVDCSYKGALDFWQKIASKVKIDSPESVKKGFNAAVQPYLKDKKSGDKKIAPGKIVIDGEAQVARFLKSQSTSSALARAVEQQLNKLEQQVMQQEELLNDNRAMRVAEGMVQTLLKEVVNCLQGHGDYTSYDFEGKQGAFIRSLTQVACDSLKDVVGYKGKAGAFGIELLIEETRGKVNKSKTALIALASQNSRNGLFSKPVKKDAEVAFDNLQKACAALQSEVQLRFAQKVINAINTQLQKSLGRSVAIFSELLEQYFVPAHQDVNTVRLPDVDADEGKAGIVETVLYDKHLISSLWLTGWKEKLGQKPSNDPDRTVEDRYKALSKQLLGVGERDQQLGPLLEAFDKLLELSLDKPDLHDQELKDEARSSVAAARRVFSETVAPEVYTISIWEALWKEAEIEAKKGTKAASAIFGEKIDQFLSKFAPLWTKHDAAGVDGIYRAGKVDLFVAPKVVDCFGSDHQAIKIVENRLARLVDFVNVGEDGGSSWNSFILAIRSDHGYPASKLFSFETDCRAAYEKLESSAKLGGTGYHHPEYKNRDLYLPLAMGDASLNRTRELVLLCEYITEKKFDFFKKGNLSVPRIEKRGANYTVVTSSRRENIKGREALYNFFGVYTDMRDDVQQRLEEWFVDSLSTQQKKSELNAFLQWATDRSQSTKGAMKAHFLQDSLVAKSFVERESRA